LRQHEQSDGTKFCYVRLISSALLDDFNDSASPCVDEDGLVIYVRVTVTVPNMIFGGDVVVSNPFFRQNHAHLKISVILIDAPLRPFPNCIFTEARSILNAEDTAHCAGSRPNCSPDNGADRSSRSAAFMRAFRRSSDSSLRESNSGKREACK
jgi:hypothetical protein